MLLVTKIIGHFSAKQLFVLFLTRAHMRVRERVGAKKKSCVKHKSQNKITEAGTEDETVCHQGASPLQQSIRQG